MTGGVVARHPAPPGLLVAALRSSAGPTLAIVARRIGDFDDAEDAVQEALAAAAQQWPREGIPESPTAWLVTVATRRAIDAVRSDSARRAREERASALEPEQQNARHTDDTLALHLLCCHPALSRQAGIALTLRAVGGLTTAEIARGLLVTESTVAQRIARAKRTLRAAGVQFAMPTAAELSDRVGAVLHVLGVIHTEAHTATEGEEISRPALSADALRLARELLHRTPSDAPWRAEVMGLIALMLFTEARAPARVNDDGDLVALAVQDRTLWRADLIAEGHNILVEALTSGELGPFQLRAAIAGVHDAASTWAETDWVEIVHLYDLLRVLDGSPMVELARLVAFAEVAGPDAALAALDALQPATPPGRTAAVRAHLLARAGRHSPDMYAEAARLAGNIAEQRWLAHRAAGSTDDQSRGRRFPPRPPAAYRR